MRELPINGYQKWQKMIISTGETAENVMTARLVLERVKGKASCRPIQEELNDNP